MDIKQLTDLLHSHLHRSMSNGFTYDFRSVGLDADGNIVVLDLEGHTFKIAIQRVICAWHESSLVVPGATHGMCAACQEKFAAGGRS